MSVSWHKSGEATLEEFLDNPSSRSRLKLRGASCSSGRFNYGKKAHSLLDRLLILRDRILLPLHNRITKGDVRIETGEQAIGLLPCMLSSLVDTAITRHCPRLRDSMDHSHRRSGAPQCRRLYRRSCPRQLSHLVLWGRNGLTQ